MRRHLVLMGVWQGLELGGQAGPRLTWDHCTLGGLPEEVASLPRRYGEGRGMGATAEHGLQGFCIPSQLGLSHLGDYQAPESLSKDSRTSVDLSLYSINRQIEPQRCSGLGPKSHVNRGTWNQNPGPLGPCLGPFTALSCGHI